MSTVISLLSKLLYHYTLWKLIFLIFLYSSVTWLPIIFLVVSLSRTLWRTKRHTNKWQYHQHHHQDNCAPKSMSQKPCARNEWALLLNPLIPTLIVYVWLEQAASSAFPARSINRSRIIGGGGNGPPYGIPKSVVKSCPSPWLWEGRQEHVDKFQKDYNEHSFKVKLTEWCLLKWQQVNETLACSYFSSPYIIGSC